MTKVAFAALIAAVSSLLLASQANALTLTNRDTIKHQLQVVEDDMDFGDGELVTQRVVIAAGETLDTMCADGCTIILENEEEGIFEGYEAIYLEDGRFVVAE